MALYPTYCPDFKILIGGEQLPLAMRGSIASITYQDGIEGADRVEVTMANPSFAFLDHPVLQVDNKLSLSLGYAPDPLEEVFVGEITGVEPTFPGSGMPTIKITAHDFLQRLAHGTKNRAFYIPIPTVGNFPLPDEVSASIVSGTNLLIPYPDPVSGAISVLITVATFIVSPALAQQGIVRQQGQTDFAFLTSLAQKNGWELYIDHTLEPRGYILRFHSMRGGDADLTLKYGESLMDFAPRLTTVGDVFGVAARVWVNSIKMGFVIMVSWDYDRAAFNLSIYPGFGELEGLIGSEAAKNSISIAPTGFAAAPQSILTELLPRLNNRLTGTGNTIGDLRIKAGRVIDLQGLGEQFSGKYRITSATHTIGSSGFKTGFQVRKEIWFGGIPTPKGVGGLFRIQGQGIG
jgi:hypothetical protein